MSWIDQNLADDFSIDSVAAICGMSRSTFTRHFKQLNSVSFSEHVTRTRLARAASMLAESESPVTDISLLSGYKNLGHFYNQFQKYYGMTPSKYRKVSLDMLSHQDSKSSSVRSSR